MFNIIIWCGITSLPLLRNHATAYSSYVITTYPRMENYLTSLKFEFGCTGNKHPIYHNICNDLRHPLTRMITLEANEERDSEFIQEWHSLFNLDDSLLSEVTYASEMDQTAATQEFNYSVNGYPFARNGLLCFWNTQFNVYLVYDLYKITTEYILVVENKESKNKHVLGLVFSPDGYSHKHSSLSGVIIEKRYQARKDVKENSKLCSLQPHELLHLCASAVYLYWEKHKEDVDDDMPIPERCTSMAVRDHACFDGKLLFPYTHKQAVDAQFRPCILKHSENSETVFHVTLKYNLYLAKNKGDNNYHLYTLVVKEDLLLKTLL